MYFPFSALGLIYFLNSILFFKSTYQQDSPEEKKTKVQSSSFRRLSFSPLTGTSSYCIRYGLIRTLSNKECKRRHTLQISQQEFEELVDDTWVMWINYQEADKSQEQIKPYTKIKYNTIKQSTQDNNISEMQFQCEKITIINCYPNSGYYSMISSLSSSPIVIPQPKFDFKSLSIRFL